MSRIKYKSNINETNIQYADIFFDIYEMLLADTNNHLKAEMKRYQFQTSENDNQILSHFIVFNYGHYNDFRNLIFDNRDGDIRYLTGWQFHNGRYKLI